MLNVAPQDWPVVAVEQDQPGQARRVRFLTIPPAGLTGSVRMPKVALLSRVKAKEGMGEELIAAFRPVFELVEQEPGTLLYVLHAHRTSDAMAAATPALAEFIAEAEFITGEPVSAKGMPA